MGRVGWYTTRLRLIAAYVFIFQNISWKWEPEWAMRVIRKGVLVLVTNGIPLPYY
jgi:hypothetical protein